ncbi:MAG: glycosyltransferase [Roseburia sp.]|nr:glycosyltransferase [Butyrivibrio sp.]MCM1440155.1 glycosyltransferase [Roseburia sp.]
MYSGNIGLYYDLPNIMSVIAKFREENDVAFLFVGEGSVLEQLEHYKEKENLTNVYFAPYQDKKNLVYSLNAGDVHFVVNAKGIKGVSVPSKLYGVMAAAKPVLGILEEGSEARLIIEEAGCGISVAPGDYPAIQKLIQRFINMKNEKTLEEMGQKGRAYLTKYLTKDVSIEKYREEIEGIKV